MLASKLGNEAARADFGEPASEVASDALDRDAASPAPPQPRRVAEAWTVAAIVAGVWAVSILWTPVGSLALPDGDPYLAENLFQRITNRALLGTVLGPLHLSPLAFRELLVGVELLWSWLVVAAVRRVVPAPIRTRTVVLWAFLVAFSLPGAANRVFPFVDVVVHAVTAGAVLLLFRPVLTWRRTVAASILMTLNLLVHELAIFELALVALWLAVRTDWRRTAVFLAPPALAVAIFAAVRDGSSRAGFDLETYLGSLHGHWDMLRDFSLNLWAIAFGGGALWLYFGALSWAASRAVAERPWRERWALRAALLTSLGLAFAPLAFAWDTARLVAIVWVPTLLVTLELGRRGTPLPWSGRLPIAALVAVHLAVPPLHSYSHGGVALNCYAEVVVDALNRVFLPREKELPNAVLFTNLHRYDVPTTDGCWPVHVFRLPPPPPPPS
jgi:hypothetical protein